MIIPKTEKSGAITIFIEPKNQVGSEEKATILKIIKIVACIFAAMIIIVELWNLMKISAVIYKLAAPTESKDKDPFAQFDKIKPSSKKSPNTKPPEILLLTGPISNKPDLDDSLNFPLECPNEHEETKEGSNPQA